MIAPIILVVVALAAVCWGLWSRDELKDLRGELVEAKRRVAYRDKRIDDTFRDWRAAEETWGAEFTQLREEHKAERRELGGVHSAEMAKQKAYQQKQLDALLLFMELHPDLADNFGKHYGAAFAPEELRGQVFDVDHEKVANYLYQQEQSNLFSEYVTAKRDAMRGPKEESNG